MKLWLVAALVALGLVMALPVAPASAATNEEFIIRLYSDFLGRGPDGDELAWNVALMANGTTRGQMATSVITSTEGKGIYAHLVYDLILDRVPTGPELTSAVTALGSGTVGLEVQLYASSEYFGDHSSTNAGYVQGLYQDVLGRTGSPGDIAYWAGEIT
ncbi:MAG TPA: DUF4214 domain-containing protein, partial [Iamia sp.]|nr:DUF4214 domain-containing protein [Iamia sp.]